MGGVGTWPAVVGVGVAAATVTTIALVLWDGDVRQVAALLRGPKVPSDLGDAVEV